MKEKRLVFHESEAAEKDLPGRKLRWLVRPDVLGNEDCSVNMVRLSPGATVTPAHSHKASEEVIYIVEGEGAVLIDGTVYGLKAGSVAVFPRKSVHMLRNTGKGEMKVVCFFAPPTDTPEYTFHEDVSFPGP